MKTVFHIIRKEFLQLKRDPKMLVLMLVAPIIQLTFLGYAANLDVEKIHIAVFDQDKSHESRLYIELLENTGYIFVEAYVNDYDSALELIDEREVIAALIIPIDFEKKIIRHVQAPIQCLFDGSDGNTASISAGYIQQATLDYAQGVMTDFYDRAGIKIQPAGNIDIEIRAWYNPELKTRVFMVPAIVALLLMMVTLLLTSLAVVKEKEIGTLEQLIVTPIRPWQLILGKLVPFAILGLVAVIIVLTAMYVIFGIGVRGSILFLFISALVFILSTLGIGLFISTISRTMQQAMMLSIFVAMMPMIYFSGFAFPLENMPEIIQRIAYAIPLKYFITIIRGVVLKGIGFAELWGDFLILLCLGIAIFIFSTLRFNKKLD